MVTRPAAVTPEFVAIGNLTIDRTSTGDALGGTVLYAALAAARFGARSAVLTRGNIDRLPDDLMDQLSSLSEQIEFVIQGSDSMTVFTNREVSGRREQTIHGWAGEIDINGLPPLWRSAPVVHLAPVAREIDPRYISRLTPGYLGITPQGWMRRWTADSFPSNIQLNMLRISQDTLTRIDGLVISAEEQMFARDAFNTVGQSNLAVVTRGRRGAAALDRGRPMEHAGYNVKRKDTVGAGDVFAAILFLLRSRRQSTARSLRFAAAAAALSVSGPGMSAVPDENQITEFIEFQASRSY